MGQQPIHENIVNLVNLVKTKYREKFIKLMAFKALKHHETWVVWK